MSARDMADPGVSMAAPPRDWADGLPADVLLAIFHRLDHIEILTAADHVCRSWHRAAREEPSLWRRITMRGHEGIARWLNRGGLACEAVRRAAGQCEAFCGEYAGDDGFLVYLMEQAPYLKSLRLISCNGVTNEGVAEAAKELPLLEELELSLCENVGGFEVFEVVGVVCPKLKHFRLCKKLFDVRVQNKDNDVRGIATMHGLHSLQLFCNLLTNKGLQTILDNCPHLECLDIRHCFNIDMDETLLLKCARINTLRIPDDPLDDYNLEVQCPIRIIQEDPSDVDVSEEESYWYSDFCYSSDDNSDGSEDDSDFYGDSTEIDDSDYYGEPSRYESYLDKYEKMLPFSMRTFVK
ncbi:unnamed protein product [Urochloa humidicola]